MHQSQGYDSVYESIFVNRGVSLDQPLKETCPYTALSEPFPHFLACATCSGDSSGPIAIGNDRANGDDLYRGDRACESVLGLVRHTKQPPTRSVGPAGSPWAGRGGSRFYRSSLSACPDRAGRPSPFGVLPGCPRRRAHGTIRRCSRWPGSPFRHRSGHRPTTRTIAFRAGSAGRG